MPPVTVHDEGIAHEERDDDEGGDDRKWTRQDDCFGGRLVGLRILLMRLAIAIMMILVLV